MVCVRIVLVCRRSLTNTRSAMLTTVPYARLIMVQGGVSVCMSQRRAYMYVEPCVSADVVYAAQSAVSKHTAACLLLHLAGTTGNREKHTIPTRSNEKCKKLTDLPSWVICHPYMIGQRSLRAPYAPFPVSAPLSTDAAR